MDLGVCGERTRSPHPTSETNGAVECNRRSLPCWVLSSVTRAATRACQVAEVQTTRARLRSHLSLSSEGLN